MEQLELGNAIGPTTDQDVFAYRLDMHRGTFLFKKSYKVQIGDFPGEDSKKFTQEFGDWFHETPYFRWAMESDAFIFIIDIAELLCSGNEYAVKISKSIRAAWQHLYEYHSEGKKNIKQKPLILAFTKSDLFIYKEETKAEETDFADLIRKLGFGQKLPEMIYDLEIHQDRINEKTAETKNEFKDLIKYLSLQSSNFNIVFTSAVIGTDNGRYGIKPLLNAALPD